MPKVTLNEDQQRWYNENAELGRELGYPECCIIEFAMDCPEEIKKRGKPTPVMILRYRMGCIDGKFTGFIPCHKHASLLFFRLTSFKKLIKNRSPLFPDFPYYANENFNP